MLQKFIYLFIFLGAFDDTWSDSLDEIEIKTAKLQLLKIVNWKVIRKWTKKSLISIAKYQFIPKCRNYCWAFNI